MIDNCTIFDFDGKKVRAVWNAEKNKRYFAVEDIVHVLTECKDVKREIKKLRAQNKKLDSIWDTICTRIVMSTSDGKRYNPQSTDLEGALLIIESVPSGNSNSLRQWLAEIGDQPIEKENDKNTTIEKYLKKLDKRSVVHSAIFSFFICIACLFQDSCQTNLFDDMDVFSQFLYLCDKPEESNDSVLYINTEYSKREIYYRNSEMDYVYGFILDRDSLLRFLEIADSIGTYKGIILDITFDKQKRQPLKDSLLIEQLRKMNMPDSVKKNRGVDRVIIVKSSKKKNFEFDDDFEEFTSKNDYWISDVSAQFVRPVLVQGDNNKEQTYYYHPALMMYNATQDNKIEPFYLWGGLYWYDSHFFRNCPPLKIHKTNNKWNYHLHNFLKYRNRVNIDNKIIILGDFSEDKHYTYAGPLPGPYLISEQYEGLKNGNYEVGWVMFVCFLVLFFIISYMIFDKRISEKIYEMIPTPTDKYLNYNQKGIVLNYCISTVSKVLRAIPYIAINYIGFGVVLFIMTIPLYYWFDYVFSTIVPLLAFTGLKFYITSTNSIKESSK